MRHRFALPRGRRLVLASVAVTIGLLGGVLVGAQVRAVQAEHRHEAAVAAADRAAAAARAERVAKERAEQAEQAAELASRWSAAADQAEAALAAADAALTASSGKVADDAVRQALATLADQVRSTVAAPPSAPSEDDVAAITTAAAALVAATTAVTDAQAAWQAEQDAAAAADAASDPPATPGSEPAFVPRGWPYDGAGPDCGSAASYEPVTSASGFHTSIPADTGDGSNGNLPRSAMAALTWCTDSAGRQQWLRADAADALTALNAAFRTRFGENIAVDLAYRSYADQVAIRDALGSIAARPGTSNHGWGTAIDVWEWQAYAFGSERYDWLVATAPTYGWVAPDWARADGSNPEYWHFEFVG